MPSFIVRRSPEREEYIVWSTVVDAPTYGVMGHDQALEYAMKQMQGVDTDLAQEQARRWLEHTDKHGSSAPARGYFWYDEDHFWWREHAPENYGEPYEAEDEPGTFIGRVLTRDEVFDACK